MLAPRQQTDSGIADSTYQIRPVTKPVIDSDTFVTPSRDSVAILRVIVCLSVIGMHFFPQSLAKWPNDEWLLPHPQWLVAHLRFGFESFFILSGFFLAHSFRPVSSNYFSAPAFLKRRLIRLALPYWIALIVLGAGWYELSAAINGIEPLVRFSEIIPAIFFVQGLAQTTSGSYALWFMAPLMQFNVLWILAFWLIRQRYLRRNVRDYHQFALRMMLIIAIASYVGSVLFTAIWGESLWKLAHNAHYLVLGGLICWSCAGKIRHQWIWAAIAIEFALAIWRMDSRPAAAALTAILLLLLSRRHLFTSSWLLPLKFIGNRSYSVYLTHTFVGHRAINFLTVSFGGASTAGKALVIWIGAIAASLAFGCVFYALVEKPAIRFSRRLSYRN